MSGKPELNKARLERPLNAAQREKYKQFKGECSLVYDCAYPFWERSVEYVNNGTWYEVLIYGCNGFTRKGEFKVVRLAQDAMRVA